MVTLFSLQKQLDAHDVKYFSFWNALLIIISCSLTWNKCPWTLKKKIDSFLMTVLWTAVTSGWSTAMLLRGFYYSLWESHDPKFNVHPKTERDSFLKCSDFTRGNYSCGHGCALRDIHHGFFCSCEDIKYKLDSFSSAVSNQKTRDTTTSMCLSLEKGADMSTVNLLIYIRFPVSCWGLG